MRTTKSKDGITGGVGPARVCHLLLARRGQEGPARARRGREGCGEERERVDLCFVWGRLLFCVFAFAFCWTLLQLPRVPFFSACATRCERCWKQPQRAPASLLFRCGLSFSTFASQRHAVPLPAISSVHFKSNSSQHSQEKIAGYNGNTYTFRLNSLSFVPNIQIFILLYISLKNS